MTKKTKTAEDYLKEPYARILTPDGDGNFVAEILEFEGCFTDGKTVTEALEKLDKAAKSWIEIKIIKKQSIPEPMASYQMSGRFALRLPQSLHSKAAMMAERDGVSLNTFIVSAVASRVGMQDLHSRLLKDLKEFRDSQAHALHSLATARAMILMQQPSYSISSNIEIRQLGEATTSDSATTIG